MATPQIRRERSPRQSGLCFWLANFAAATGFMLLLDLAGMRLPRSIVYWFNPVAWASNRIGVTPRIGGILGGMDQGVMSIASVLGVPVIGSFLLWFAMGWFRWRRPGLVFLVFVIPALCAMQFTTERAYESLAGRFHERGRTELERDAISKALFILQQSGSANTDPKRLEARLREIEGQVKAASDTSTSPK